LPKENCRATCGKPYITSINKTDGTIKANEDQDFGSCGGFERFEWLHNEQF